MLQLCVAISLCMSVPAFAGDTWDGGHGSADAACRARIDESGAYRYAEVKVQGDVGHCYVIAKEDGKEKIYDAAVTRDEPAPEAQNEEAAGAGGPPAPPAPAPTTAPKPKPKPGAGPLVLECVQNKFGSDFEAELNRVYATGGAGTGGAGSGVFTTGNVAVLEWTEGGTRKTEAFSSGNQGTGHKHSEQFMLEFLASSNIPKTSVTRIFTELSPCAKVCLPALMSYFDGVSTPVKVQYFWLHDSDKVHKDCSGANASQTRLEEKANRRKKVTGS